MIDFAFAVLLECSSSMITINSVPARCASAMRSKRFLRSLSRIAVLPFLVTNSQLMKVVLSASNPAVRASNKFCVRRCGANLRIFWRLCSSRSPLPGHSQMNAVRLLILVRYSSIKSIRIMVLPEPVGDFTVTVCLLRLSETMSSSLRTAFSWNSKRSIAMPFTMFHLPPSIQY